jgi:hypothetical protein
MEVIKIEGTKVTVTIRVTKEKSRQLKMKCLQEETTIQAVLEKAINDFLMTGESKNPE